MFFQMLFGDFWGGGVDLNQQKFATKRRNNRGSTVRPRMEEEHITLHKDSRLKPQTLSFFKSCNDTFSKDNNPSVEWIHKSSCDLSYTPHPPNKIKNNMQIQPPQPTMDHTQPRPFPQPQPFPQVFVHKLGCPKELPTNQATEFGVADLGSAKKKLRPIPLWAYMKL